MTTCNVYSAAATALDGKPVFQAFAFKVFDASIETAPPDVTRESDCVGSDPLSVYRISASGVATVTVTFSAVVYVPAATEKAGFATRQS